LNEVAQSIRQPIPSKPKKSKSSPEIQSQIDELKTLVIQQQKMIEELSGKLQAR
jgi:hypothetical protein